MNAQKSISPVDWVDEGWEASPSSLSQFNNANKVWQDGSLAFRRAPDGTIWGLLGHTNKGGLSLWKGDTLDTMEMVTNEFKFNFKMGPAGDAFNGTRYPSGPRARGQIWPMGLWIDKTTGKFYAYLHNETGWGAGETAYTVHRQQRGEPDFRNIGMMSSSDSGLTWDFEGWIIAHERESWSQAYRPDEITHGGQPLDDLCLGAGDFSLFANERDGYLYIFYSTLWTSFVDGAKARPSSVSVARAPMSSNGLPGSWKNFYEGSFGEDARGGKATPVFGPGLWPSVNYNTVLGKYMLSSTYGHIMISLSDDLVNWSEMKNISSKRDDFRWPYFTLIDPAGGRDLQVTGDTFRVYTETNGTDVYKFDVRIKQP